MRRYTAQARRSAGSWMVDIHELPELVIAARRLDQVETSVRDAIALARTPPGGGFIVTVVPLLPEPVAELVEAARLGAPDLIEGRHLRSAEIRRAVVALADSGYCVRDTCWLLGVNARQVSRLLAAARRAPSHPPPRPPPPHLPPLLPRSRRSGG